MAITHATVKAPGQTLAAVADWNAGHAADAVLVPNLNADLLDGHDSGFFAPLTSVYWQRAATTISPLTAGDNLQMSGGNVLLNSDTGRFYLGAANDAYI